MRVAILAAVASFAAVVPQSRAQFTGDPFDPYRNAYAASAYPTYSNVGPLSRNYRYTNPLGIGLGVGTGNASMGEIPYVSNLNNQLYSNPGVVGLNGAPPIPGMSTGRRASPAEARFNDRQIQRESDFAQGQQDREDLYFEAMNEQDPARKADLMRRYREEMRRSSLGMSRGATGPRARAEAGATTDPPPSSRRREADLSPANTYEDMLRYNRTLFGMLLKGVDGPPPPTDAAPR